MLDLAGSLLTQSQFIKQAKWIKDTTLAFSMIKKNKDGGMFLGSKAPKQTSLSNKSNVWKKHSYWMFYSARSRRGPFPVNGSVQMTRFVHEKGSLADLRSLWVNNQRLTCGVKPCNWSDTSKGQLAPHSHSETLHGANRPDRTGVCVYEDI